MNKKIIFLFFISLASCGPQRFSSSVAPVSEPDFFPPSIVGGQKVEKEIFAKHVVALYNKKSRFSCTATLISKNVLLTAAHCANVDTPADYVAIFAKTILNNAKSIQRPIVDARVFDYNPTGFYERKDLALVRFKGPLPQGYEPMPLPTASELKEMGNTFYAAGYGTSTGREDQKSQDYGVLRYTQLKVLEGRLSPISSQFTVDQSPGHGICHGDSGGPAFVKLRGRRILVGVASAVYSFDRLAQSRAGFDICRCNAIYISTYFYSNWIRSNLEALSH